MFYFKCGCGSYNFTWQDWISHFKYGEKGFWHNVKLLLLTKIRTAKQYREDW